MTYKELSKMKKERLINLVLKLESTVFFLENDKTYYKNILQGIRSEIINNCFEVVKETFVEENNMFTEPSEAKIIAIELKNTFTEKTKLFKLVIEKEGI